MVLVHVWDILSKVKILEHKKELDLPRLKLAIPWTGPEHQNKWAIIAGIESWDDYVNICTFVRLGQFKALQAKFSKPLDQDQKVLWYYGKICLLLGVDQRYAF